MILSRSCNSWSLSSWFFGELCKLWIHTHHILFHPLFLTYVHQLKPAPKKNENWGGFRKIRSGSCKAAWSPSRRWNGASKLEGVVVIQPNHCLGFLFRNFLHVSVGKLDVSNHETNSKDWCCVWGNILPAGWVEMLAPGGGNSNSFSCSFKFWGRWIQFDEHIFSDGSLVWKNP